MRPLHAGFERTENHGHRQHHARFIFRRRHLFGQCSDGLSTCGKPCWKAGRILSISAANPRARARLRCRRKKNGARVQPVLEELVKWQVPMSLDTRRTAVMQQALAHGYADIINDVAALGDEGAIGLLAQQAHTGICLMHMQGMPETMQQSPSYQDVAGKCCAISTSGWRPAKRQACARAAGARPGIWLR